MVSVDIKHVYLLIYKTVLKQSKADLQGIREREWFIEKDHEAMSIVVMNTVKQLLISIKLQVQVSKWSHT